MNWLQLWADHVFYGTLACAIVLGMHAFDRIHKGGPKGMA